MHMPRTDMQNDMLGEGQPAGCAQKAENYVQGAQARESSGPEIARCCAAKRASDSALTHRQLTPKLPRTGADDTSTKQIVDSKTILNACASQTTEDLQDVPRRCLHRSTDLKAAFMIAPIRSSKARILFQRNLRRAHCHLAARRDGRSLVGSALWTAVQRSQRRAAGVTPAYFEI